MGFALGMGLAAVGFIGPDFILNKKIRARQERLSQDLPDALDLLAVSVEAGLGFDAAVVKITEQVEGPLGEEFALTLNEMRIGESRQEALKKLAERTGISEIGAFARAIIQADQFGISLGPDPPRPGRGHASPAADRGRGEGDEGAGEDALPDGDLHLPVDVHRHPRARLPEPHEDPHVLGGSGGTVLVAGRAGGVMQGRREPAY